MVEGLVTHTFASSGILSFVAWNTVYDVHGNGAHSDATTPPRRNETCSCGAEGDEKRKSKRNVWNHKRLLLRANLGRFRRAKGFASEERLSTES